MIPTKTIQLDFWRHPTDILHLVQGEADGRKVEFKIFDNGSAFDLTGYTVQMAVKKPDGNIVVNAGSITDAANGVCEVTITSQVVAVVGSLHAELQILKEGQLSKSFRIVTKVAAGVDAEGIAPSVTEFGVLTDLITDVNTVLAIADTDLWPEVVANAEYFTDLGGLGRTDETVKGNADDISDLADDLANLAGDGRTIETVKGNADDIAGHIADDENPHTVTLAQLGAAADADLADLAGPGRTIETVKGNADDIAGLAGAGRNTETVKKNADDIALKANADDLADLAGDGRTNQTVKANADAIALKANATDLSNLAGTGRTVETVKANSDAITNLAGLGRTDETVKGNADDISDLADDLANLAGDGRTTETVKGAADAVTNLSGTGRTTETVKGNADEIADVAGVGRTTETVKGNADEIAAVEAEIETARAGSATLGSRIDAIEDRASRAAKIYGVKFTGSNSAGVRTHDAVGMVANVGVDDQVVVNDFDNVSFFQRPRCLVYHDEDGRAQVMAYEGEPGFSLTGAAFPPRTEKAQVFYEQKPFYWNGDLGWPQVTATPLEGFELAPMFKNPVDKVYLPSYWMGEDGGKACSLSGTYPAEVSISTGVTSARTYHPRAHLETMDARICEYVLQLVEFATRDVQTVMMGASSMRHNGNDISVLAETGVNRIVMANASADQYVVGQTICIGTTKNGSQITPRVVIAAIETYDPSNKAIEFDGPPLDIPLGAFTSTRAYRNGATDIVKASSGSPVSNSSGKYPCIWRGKVDPWAGGYSAISDVLIQRAGEGTPEDPYSYTPYRLPDPTLYNAGAIDSNWVKVGYNLETKDGYVTALGSDPKSPGVRMTTDVDGSPTSGSTNYFASYYYYPRYAVSAVFVGGSWDSGRSCSPVYFYLHHAPSGSNFGRLARLFVAPL